MIRVQVVGGGRMGEALVVGVVASGHATAEQVRVVELVSERRDAITASVPGVEVTDRAGQAEGTIIAVKPSDAVSVAAEVAAAGGGRILSIAAGVTLASLEAAAGDGRAVIRAMPNTPALVGRGATAIAAGGGADAQDVAWAEEILSSVGVVMRVPESQLDAVTGLSGSGPAYVFLFVEALTEAGVLAGLPRSVAEILATETLVGSALLLADSQEGPAALRAAVTSPGGTTAAGLRILEQRGLRAALLDAVVAARDRASELS